MTQDSSGPWPPAGATWAAAVDCLGGTAHASLLAELRRGGAAVALGETVAARLNSELAAFSEKAVSLLGVEAANAPRSRNAEAWERWCDCVDTRLDLLTCMVGLEEVVPTAEALLAGRLRGRVVVDIARRSPVPSTLH